MNRIFSLTFILFLTCKSSIISAQDYCDSTKLPWVVSNIMPQCNISADELEFILNRDVPLVKYNTGDGKVFYVGFNINCIGECFNYKVWKSDNENFNKAIIECISYNTKWSPAYIKRKNKFIPVDFSLVLEFKNQNGRIVYMDSKVVDHKKHHYFIKRGSKNKK